MSVPHLFRLSTVGTSSFAASTNEITTLRERNSILARNNAYLNGKLLSLKHFIESSKCSTSRVFSNNGSISSYKSSSAINDHSLHFDLAADLTQVNSLTMPNKILLLIWFKIFERITLNIQKMTDYFY